MSTARHILEDPGWFAFQFSEDWREIEFVRVDGTVLREEPFLDERILPRVTARNWVSVSDLATHWGRELVPQQSNLCHLPQRFLLLNAHGQGARYSRQDIELEGAQYPDVAGQCPQVTAGPWARAGV